MCYFPPKHPELSAIERCWDPLQEWFKYRLMPDFSTLKSYLP
ncbi:transposase [Halorhabdus utahensis]|nr:transposase [Halorhabdus utahensis]